MEQDINENIKILERMLKIEKECLHYDVSQDEIRAIEHLIKAYKELEEENRKLKEHCKEQIKDKQELTTALLDSIPISLVEKKMEELKQQGNYKTLENPDGRVHFQAEPCDYKIQVLQELLEKRK